MPTSANPKTQRSSLILESIYAPVFPSPDILGEDLTAPSEITAKDLEHLYSGIGFGGTVRDILVNTTMGWFQDQPEPRTRQDLQFAIDRSLLSLQWKTPNLFLLQQDERNPGPLLTEPKPPVVIPGEGRVRRAQSGRNGATSSNNRPFVSFWIERDPNSPCQEYEWYQFVRPTFFINGRERRRGNSFRSLTEGTAVFGKWRPDLDADRIQEAEKTRPKGAYPDFKPTDLKTPEGKPYYGFTIPRSNGQIGLIDAPDFSRRGKNNEPSPLEQQWWKVRNNAVRSDKQPRGGIDNVTVNLEFRSYLLCVDQASGTCKIVVPWTYVIRAQIRYDWKQVKKIELGMAKPRWKRRILRTTYTFTSTISDTEKC